MNRIYRNELGSDLIPSWDFSSPGVYAWVC